MSCSLSLSLSFRLIPWSAGALWVHFPARASKTLSRRRSAPSPHREGTWGLREQSKPRTGALLAFCINQGISASFSLLYCLISRLWTTRFRSIKGPQHWGKKIFWIACCSFPSPIYESEKRKWSLSVMSDTQRSHGLQPSRLLCPWNFPGKSTGVGCHYLLHILSYKLGIFSRDKNQKSRLTNYHKAIHIKERGL